MATVDLAVPIRNTIIASPAITTKLTSVSGSFPVYTRRPVPGGLIGPVIVISPDISESNSADGINDLRPVLTRDIAVYGSNDTAQHYRDIEIIAYVLRDLFHRKKPFVVSGWALVIINVTGPIVAPVDDDDTVARLVTLNIQLAKLGI